MPDRFVADKYHYPALYEACDAMSHDGGGRCGWPAYLLDITPEIGSRVETALQGLSVDDRGDFAIGCDVRMKEIAARSEDLTLAHEVLGKWFDEGSPHVTPRRKTARE